MAEQQTSSKQITRKTLISDILVEHEDKSDLLAEILLDFGIHCFACGAAVYENLEQGVLGHGYSEEDLQRLLRDLNRAVGEDIPEDAHKTSELSTLKNFDIKFTEGALEKIKQAMEQSNREHPILRVSALGDGCCGLKYHMEFLDSPGKSDVSFKKDNIDVCIDKESMEDLNGAEVDYVEKENDSGFKFKNPNEGSCGCSH
ncbi:MAG: iron-sulfur cluster assembly accessory protein [Candidatus Pacearchaeota archaeon]